MRIVARVNVNSQESTATQAGQVAHPGQAVGLSRKQFESQQQPPEQTSQQRIVGQLLTRRQVAERWSCCEHTIARNRSLKPIRFNRRMLRYRLENVEAVEAAAV